MEVEGGEQPAKPRKEKDTADKQIGRALASLNVDDENP